MYSIEPRVSGLVLHYAIWPSLLVPSHLMSKLLIIPQKRTFDTRKKQEHRIHEEKRVADVSSFAFYIAPY